VHDSFHGPRGPVPFIFLEVEYRAVFPGLFDEQPPLFATIFFRTGSPLAVVPTAFFLHPPPLSWVVTAGLTVRKTGCLRLMLSTYQIPPFFFFFLRGLTPGRTLLWTFRFLGAPPLLLLVFRWIPLPIKCLFGCGCFEVVSYY